MNITKKLVAIILIITIVICSNLNLFNTISYADDENTNTNTSGEETSGSGQQNQETPSNTTESDNNNQNENKNENANASDSNNQQEQEQNQNQSSSEENTTPKTTTTKSSNASLSYLKVEPNDFKGFKSEITSYNVEVENDITSVSIIATPKDGAVYSVSGNKNLKVGKNKVTITVTSEDKTNTKNYYVYVTRKEKEEDKKDEEKKEENTSSQEINFEDKVNDKVLGLSKLTIEGMKLSPEFKSDIYEYTVNYEGEAASLNIITTPGQEGSNVEIIGNENLADGENLINILVTDNDGNIYTYQITLKKNMSKSQMPMTKEMLLAIGIGAGIVLLIIIVVISRKIKKGKNKIKKEEVESIPVIEDNIDEEAERIAFVNSILQTNVEPKEEQKPYVQDSWFKKEEIEEDKEDKEEKIEKQEEEGYYSGPLIYEPEDNYDYNYEEKEEVKNKSKKKRAKGKRFK